VGYQLTPHLRATFGSTFLYWNRVARSGDQIDLAVNTNFIPPPIANTGGALNPSFAFHDTAFWAMGLNFGLEFHW
jgi:hypothetical protein